MKSVKMLRILNLLLAADFLVIGVTAILNDLIQTTGFYFYFHAIPGFVFLILVILHLTLNWKWIKTNYLKSGKKGNA